MNSEQNGVIFADELFRCAARQIADAPPSVWNEVQAVAQVFDCPSTHVVWACIAGSVRSILTAQGIDYEDLYLQASTGVQLPLGMVNPLSTLLHVKEGLPAQGTVMSLHLQDAPGLVHGMEPTLNALLVAAILAGQMGEVNIPLLTAMLDEGVPDVDTLIDTMLVSVVGEERLGQAFKE